MSATIVETTDLVTDPIDPVVSNTIISTTTEADGVIAPDALVLATSTETEALVSDTTTTTETVSTTETLAISFDATQTQVLAAETASLTVMGTETTATTVDTTLTLSTLNATVATAASSTGANVFVSDAAGLMNALAAAQDGDVIHLAGGDYGQFNLSGYSTSVTLISDPNDPAVFSQVQFDTVTGMTFDGVTFDYTFSAGDAEYFRPFRFTNCSDITLQNSLVDGDLASGRGDLTDGFANATGLRFEGGSNIQIVNNEIRGFKDNVQLSNLTDVVLSNNEIHHMREDAVEFGSLTNALFENNYLHNTLSYELPADAPAGSGDHPDFFQINGGGARSPCSNLTIRGNLMDQGSGTGAQGIFLTNKDTVPWQNITIEDNMYINNRGNGIMVGLTDGLVVRNNTILHSAWDLDDSFSPGIKLDANSTNAVVTGNISGTAGILTLPASWVASDNFVLQSTDPTAPGYYADYFVGLSGDLAGHPEKFLLDPNSDIYTSGAGSSHVYDIADDALIARMMVLATDSTDTFVFDANLSSVPVETLMEASVSAPVLSAPIETAPTASADLITFATLTGDFTDATGAVLADLAPGAIDLRGLESLIRINRTDIQPMLDSDEFRIDLTLQADTTAGNSLGGEILRLDRAFYVEVTKAGELEFRMKAADGTWYKIETTGATLTDGAAHDVSVRYTADQAVQLLVDGQVLAETEISGTLGQGVASAMVIGGQYGATPFGGSVSNLLISLDADGSDAVVEAPVSNDTVLLPEMGNGCTYLWDFGDGTQATGLIVNHTFDTVGYHQVTLTITDAFGDVDTAEYTVGVAGTGVLGFDSATGDFCRTAYGAMTVVVDLPEGALDLRDLESLVRIDRTEIQSILDNDTFQIDLGLSLDPTETGAFGGEILRLDRAFLVSVTNKGEIEFRVKTTDGVWNTLTTNGADIEDGAHHDVSLRFDAQDLIQVLVDGTVLAETNISADLYTGTAAAMVIGGQYGATAFGGLVDSLDIDLAFHETPSSETFDAVVDMLAGTDTAWTNLG